MADIRALRAYRYDLGRVGNLSGVVAPPYDVIDPILQNQLYDRSPYNVVRLILNREEPGDSLAENRYTRAARFSRTWRRENVLVRDSAQSLYVCHQEFEIGGRRYIRRGFMARVRLENPGEGQIFPHEETMSGPKEDRLKLTRATGMNLSPIFGLYPDEEGETQGILDAAVARSLPLEATDHLGGTTRLWPVTDQRVISAVTGLLGPHPIFIADGHHRYETALRYLEERRQAGEAADPESAPNFVLTTLVRMNDPGLVILPTHRLVSALPALTADQLRACLDGLFDVTGIGSGAGAADEAWLQIEAANNQEWLGFGTAADRQWQIARFRAPEVMAQLVPEHGPAWRGLAVSVLHRLVLDRLLPERLGARPQCRYVHQVPETAHALDARACELAVLVPPATMELVRQIAGRGEKMPPKSTYFFPKLLSGLVFNPLTES